MALPFNWVATEPFFNKPDSPTHPGVDIGHGQSPTIGFPFEIESISR
jgi:hypothetical protein